MYSSHLITKIVKIPVSSVVISFEESNYDERIISAIFSNEIIILLKSYYIVIVMNMEHSNQSDVDIDPIYILSVM